MLKANENTELIAWNVGQGQWITIASPNSCLHFDMGGEVAPWDSILRACALKPNNTYFSHWDIDHLSFAARASRRFQNFCIQEFPGGPAPSSKKRILLSSLPKCTMKNLELVKEIFKVSTPQRKLMTSNDYSNVFEFAHWMLVPGDSPKRQEKLWAPQIIAKNSIRVLILGHHGSRTSTSQLLLSSLLGLKMAVSTARKSRYGHPHPEVLARLKRNGVAALLTEDWGNIHIETSF